LILAPWRMYSNWKDRKRADKYVNNLKREIMIKQKTKEFDRMQKYLQEKAPKEMKGKGPRPLTPEIPKRRNPEKTKPRKDETPKSGKKDEIPK
jgi:hypothetical protein